MKYTWNILQEQSGDVLDQLLMNRGIPREELERFFEPDWDRDTIDPMVFTRMSDAVQRVFQALEQGEKIFIHGDYDADGVSGCSLLYSALCDIIEKLKYEKNITVFLPDREKDGYGVAMHTVERAVSEGFKLMITVDCGIANAEQLDRAHELGMDVIICDHHQLAPELPKHAIIIHPLAPGEVYENKHLCGTGVAFKLASALIREAQSRGADFPAGYEKWFLDLVAVATVTDVMPLTGENRILEKYGLLVLNKTKRQGLKKIVDFSSGTMGQIDTQTIGFQIGPRLNAAGRIKSAEIAFKALTASTDQDAEKYAGELELLNRERQRISDAAFREAKAMVEEREAGDPVHIVWSETWMPGVVGLIAGKLVSEFGVPAFALTRVGDHYVGSGRSIGGLHLVEAMQACGDIFLKAGGHPQACGLSLESVEKIELFRERMSEQAKVYFKGKDTRPTIHVDLELPLNQINWDVYHTISKFAPFGEKNPRPKFLARSVTIVSADAIGKQGDHLRLSVTGGAGSTQKMIGFRFGKWANELTFGDKIDVVYEIDVNEWNGKRELQCRIEDLRKTT